MYEYDPIYERKDLPSPQDEAEQEEYSIDAMREGKIARHAGKSIHTNPFPAGTREGWWWRNGWQRKETL